VGNLDDRRALVTGGDSGIGRGVALELARRGAAVVVADLEPLDAAEDVCRAVRELGRPAQAVAMDVADEEQVVAGFAAAAEALGGPVDLLVNNAGIEMPHLLTEMPLADWRKVLDVNLTGAFLCSREAARGLIGAGARGVIVNVSSVHERIPWRRYSHYCASKGGMKLFMESIANELAPHRIRVVNVAPGAIETPINRGVLEDPEQRERVEEQIPLGRWGTVDDIARVVGWLATDEATYITGTTIFVDGGMTLYPNFE
jgi:glucose 1-dehydrogenase